MSNNNQDRKQTKFERILVPVTGAEADEYAIELACRLFKPDKSEIYAVYIITIKRDLPLDAQNQAEIQKAEEALSHIEGFAREQGCRVKTDVLQARDAGPAILDETAEREADLILMGVTYKRRFGEFSLGEVVPYVLKNAPCRVILYHQHTHTSETTP